MNATLEHSLSRIVDAGMALLPWRAPDAAQLQRARIVAHRGQRDGQAVKENTYAAFDPAIRAGVAAIEFDVRYTRDGEPVVIHDADLQRVFSRSTIVAETDWKRLHAEMPCIPHVADLMERYASSAHLLVELKTRGTARAEQRLADLLGAYEPIAAFHILSLDTDLFEALPGLPLDCRLPVAKFNLKSLLDWSLREPCAGLAGPYMLMRRHQIHALQARREMVGSGFVRNRAVLMREIGRGVEWIFTNEPVLMQQALDRARRAARTT